MINDKQIIPINIHLLFICEIIHSASLSYKVNIVLAVLITVNIKLFYAVERREKHTVFNTEVQCNGSVHK